MKLLFIISLVWLCQTTLGQSNPPPPPPVDTNAPKSKSNGEYEFPDVDASFKGGTKALQQYINKHLQYPKKALDLGEQGKVYVTFTVTKKGKVKFVEIARGASESLNEEALRVVKNMPKWNPAKLRGKKINSRAQLPIAFTLK